MEKINTAEHNNNWEVGPPRAVSVDVLYSVVDDKARIIRDSRVFEGKMGAFHQVSSVKEMKNDKPKHDDEAYSYFYEREVSYGDASILDQVKDPKFHEWLQENQSKILSVDDIKEWAENNVATPEDYERLVACVGCSGLGEADIGCACILDSNDLSADSNCKECGGTGESINECYGCKGEAWDPVYPNIKIHDPENNTTREILFDLAAMIREYPDGLKQRFIIEEGLSGQSVTVGAMFNVAECLTSGEVDTEGNSRVYLESAGPEGYMVNPGRMFGSVGFQVVHWYYTNHTSGLEFEGYDSAQKHLASKALFSTRSYNSNEYTLHRVPDPESRLRDIVDLAAECGYAVGSTSEFYATGETAPSIYLVDDDNRFAIPLDSDYVPEDLIESSWTELTKLVRSGAIKPIRDAE